MAAGRAFGGGDGGVGGAQEGEAECEGLLRRAVEDRHAVRHGVSPARPAAGHPRGRQEE